MHLSPPPRRGRLVAAVIVSVGVHALIGVAWLTGPNRPTVYTALIDSRAPGPDEGVTIDVREPRVERVERPAAKPQAAKAPAELPPSIVRPRVPVAGDVRPVAGSPAGPEAPAKPAGDRPLHGKLRPGQTIVYLLDRSASMGPDGLLPRAVAALRASLAQLGPDTRFQIVAYNGGTTTFGPTPIPGRTDAVERADRWLGELTAEGRSDHRAGFVDALAVHPDMIVLLTDADDLDESDVRAIRSRLRPGVTLTAIVLGGRRAPRETPLDRLTRATGGEVRHVER